MVGNEKLKISEPSFTQRFDDYMESSKRCVKLVSLIFIIRCLTKSNLKEKFIVKFLQCLGHTRTF